MQVDANTLRGGHVISHEGKLWVIMKSEIMIPGKGNAIVQIDMRDARTGTKTNVRFRTQESVEKVHIDEDEMNYLFGDDENFTFMNNENFEQVTISKDVIGDKWKYLQENMTCTVRLHEGVPLTVDLPQHVTLEIVEADPHVKGQTATSSYKRAKLSNGVTILVPPFIESGERVVVNTNDDSYVERAQIMAARSAIMTVMTKAAEKAGKALLRDFGEVEKLQVSQKGPADFVSKADVKSEEIIKEVLMQARPSYGFMGEESATTRPSTEYTWVVDPLDGTLNFLHGIPHWCISIGLLKGDEPIAGVVFDPVRDEMFWGEKGTGAFSNAQRLRVSGRNKLNESLLATGIPFKGSDKKNFIQELEGVMMQVAGVRRQGAAALDLAYVAAGRYEAYWEHDLKAWDVAAGVLLVTEAGGLITPFKKGELPQMGADMLASNFALHKEFCGIFGIEARKM